MNQTIQILLDTYGEELGFHEVSNAEIGYTGYSNKKFKIKSEENL